jgi:hypothetical protein
VHTVTIITVLPGNPAPAQTGKCASAASVNGLAAQLPNVRTRGYLQAAGSSCHDEARLKAGYDLCKSPDPLNQPWRNITPIKMHRSSLSC